MKEKFCELSHLLLHKHMAPWANGVLAVHGTARDPHHSLQKRNQRAQQHYLASADLQLNNKNPLSCQVARHLRGSEEFHEARHGACEKHAGSDPPKRLDPKNCKKAPAP